MIKGGQGDTVEGTFQKPQPKGREMENQEEEVRTSAGTSRAEPDAL